MRTALERFTEKYEPITETGCWIWIGAYASIGYGHLKINGKSVYAHRFSYETFIGKIPDNLYVCHMCDIPSCVNPHHLFVGTAKDNARDAIKKNRRKRNALGRCNTACKYGHAMTTNNTYVSPRGIRFCLTCKKEYRKRYYWEHK